MKFVIPSIIIAGISALLVYVCVVLALGPSEIVPNPDGNVLLATTLGEVRGTILTSTTGKKFYAFRGIRYGQPPVGNLRFRPPRPIEPWNETFDATSDGPMCPQPAANLTDVSEDCLRINIYTHNLPDSSNRTGLKPVLVYIHPGGFYSLSGQSHNFAGPLYLMDRDTLFVTLNYRLGSLGFLSTGSAEAPGNNGLKDQVMALKWIQKYIDQFGGDPNAVTLLGYSAGAMSITLHMVSPMSKGLFHRAIVMSGSAIAQWEIPTNQIDLARKQAKILNCTDETIGEMIECFRKRGANDFGTSLEQMFEFGSGDPIILFKPVVEPDFGQERFLVDDPSKAFSEGRFWRVPIIAGITKDEFAGSAIYTLKDDELRSMLGKDFKKWAPVNFLYERDTQRSFEASQGLREYYLDTDTLTLNRSLVGVGQLYADGVIGFGMDRFIDLASNFTPVYRYCFTYQGRYSHVYYPTNDKPYGVVHHDDLLYLLTVPLVAPIFTANDPERATVERLTRMWTTFASKGQPVDPFDEYLKDVQWKQFDHKQNEYLEIGENLTLKSDLYKDRYNVWNNLFPLQ